jgi:tetratricopeptide (TPR) repeat protein
MIIHANVGDNFKKETSENINNMTLKNLFNKNADQLAKEAIHDYQNGKDEFKVIEKLHKALKIGIKHYPLDQIYNHIGASYYDLALYDKAKEAYEKGLEYNPKNHSLLSNLGAAFQKLGDLEKSIPYYKASLEIKPDNSFAYNNIGLYLYENGNYIEAMENLDRAIQINPGLMVSYDVKARCLAYVGKYKESEGVFKEAIKRGLDNAQLLREELEKIKAKNPQVFFDLQSLKILLQKLSLNKEKSEMIIMAQDKPIEFYKNNGKYFEGRTLTSFEISNALYLFLLITILQSEGKLLYINENTEIGQIQIGIKEILSSNGFEVGGALDEFENLMESDSEVLLTSIASKLKISNSIELLNIWISDNELNIFPLDKEKWDGFEYPFTYNINGFGKICPIASMQTMENWLINN